MLDAGMDAPRGNAHRSARFPRIQSVFQSPYLKNVLFVVIGCLAVAAVFLLFYISKYSAIIDQRFNGEVFARSAGIYADAPGFSQELVRQTTVKRALDMAAPENGPQLMTTYFDASRTRRRLLAFEQVPPILMNAVLVAEDRRFFNHYGVSPTRIAGAFWSNLRHRKRQGGSTIT